MTLEDYMDRLNEDYIVMSTDPMWVDGKEFIPIYTDKGELICHLKRGEGNG